MLVRFSFAFKKHSPINPPQLPANRTQIAHFKCEGHAICNCKFTFGLNLTKKIFTKFSCSAKLVQNFSGSFRTFVLSIDKSRLIKFVFVRFGRLHCNRSMVRSTNRLVELNFVNLAVSCTIQSVLDFVSSLSSSQFEQNSILFWQGIRLPIS